MDPAPSSPPAATASASPNLDPAAAPPAPSTPALIVAMLRAFDTASDLIFSPGRAPQVERSGQLIEVQIPGVGKLTPASVQQIASDIMERSEFAARKLAEEGSADFSYSIAQVARFRVNVFRQRGSCAIVMRVIPNVIPPSLRSICPRSWLKSSSCAMESCS
jgi:twitching motility protein PilT